MFERPLYWPDDYLEVQEFMPEYVYLNPEIAALETLKKELTEEAMADIAAAGGKPEDAVDTEENRP